MRSTCGVALPYYLAPGAELVCTYAVGLPNATNLVNTVAVETDGPVGGGEALANVVFADPTTCVDECVDVSDDMGDPSNPQALGTVCVDSVPGLFSYRYTVPTDECGPFEIVNTASLVANDTGTTGEYSQAVGGEVAGCGNGCTLGKGYWKTHSNHGPAPFDDNWLNLPPNGADSVFFLSGQSFHQILWTPPRGNAYYILAQAFIAAQLNALNGASLAAPVLDAYDQAVTALQTYTPGEVASLKGKSGEERRNPFLLLAVILDAYNNGELGPGRCDETPTP